MSKRDCVDKESPSLAEKYPKIKKEGRETSELDTLSRYYRSLDEKDETSELDPLSRYYRALDEKDGLDPLSRYYRSLDEKDETSELDPLSRYYRSLDELDPLSRYYRAIDEKDEKERYFSELGWRTFIYPNGKDGGLCAIDSSEPVQMMGASARAGRSSLGDDGNIYYVYKRIDHFKTRLKRAPEKL
jgi:hypothetical protein